jgi:DNA-binding NtrC family response regulator
MDKPKRILLIDDNIDLTTSVSKTLDGYAVFCAASGLEGLEKAEHLRPDLVLLDLIMPGIGGMEVLRALKKLGNLPVIIMTAHGRVDTAVRAMKLGAEDFLAKPIDTERLKKELDRFFSVRGKTSRRLEARQHIVGDSAIMNRVWQLVDKFAPPDIPILLEGESGTGKELFSRAIHEMSKRSEGPLVPLDCGSFPETLAESEFFGFEKGAFTGAEGKKAGLFESAHNGTLFLDEVSNLPLGVQAKLLRVLQDRRVYHLGSNGSRPIDVDFRLIAATNADLREMIKTGAFRADLYFRMSTVTIRIPPLRERVDDIRVLANHFIKMHSKKFGSAVVGLSPECAAILKEYRWPGNIRELENVIKYSILFAEDVISPSHLPKYLSSGISNPTDSAKEQFHLFSSDGLGLDSSSGSPCAPEGKEMSMSIKFGLDMGNGIHLKELSARAAEEAERNIIREVMSKKKFSRAQLAEFLCIDPKTLRTKLKRLQISA